MAVKVYTLLTLRRPFSRAEFSPPGQYLSKVVNSRVHGLLKVARRPCKPVLRLATPLQLTAIFLLAAYLIGKIALTMVWAKFWIMVSYDGIYVYSGELFPTVVRSGP